ncbi:MAG: phosphotransferase, partial [Pseudomonadota bacterium]
QRLEEALGDAQLPRLVIHGDFGIHNMLFHDNESATLLDFELARLEWRLSDLVLVLRASAWKTATVF